MPARATSDLRKTQDDRSLSLRERARVRGNETQPTKRPDQFCKFNSTGSLRRSWLSHRAKSLSMVEGRAVASAVVFRAFLPPHPALSLEERENGPPRFANPERLDSSQRGMRFSLSLREGPG